MLDDKNLLAQRDPGSTRTSAVAVTMQTDFAAEVESPATPSEVANVVLAGMGGSALAADMVKVLTADRIMVPLEVVKGYQLPHFVNEKTLVVTISHSGNTEETMSCYRQAREHGCQLAVMATGGKLFAAAEADNVPRVRVPSGSQPRMSTIYHLRGLLKLLSQFEVIDDSLYHAVAASGVWLKDQLSQWAEEVALKLIGSTQVFYAGELTWPLAYKWKISFNESAKNVAFWNQYPEFSHNEFIGWSSHPVDKPYKVVDFRSSLERPRIRERMELTDRLLSGMRPKAEVVELQGETLIEQLLWGLALGEIVSIYAGILNGVNPEPVALVEQLKKELS